MTESASASSFAQFHHPHTSSLTSDHAQSFDESSRDSPPGLTASGSSDDGSSPSSVAHDMSSTNSTHPDDTRHSTPAPANAAPASNASTKSASVYDAALSPSSWIDNHPSPADHNEHDSMITSHADWASPIQFPNNSEHNFSPMSNFHSSTHHSLHSHDFDNEDFSRFSSNASASSSSSAASHDPAIAAPVVDAEAKRELRDASHRIMATGLPAPGHLSDQHNSSASHMQYTTSHDEDEQMFDSIIEENSFGPASTSASDYGGASPQPITSPPHSTSSPQPVKPLSTAFGAMHIPTEPQPIVKTEMPTPSIEHNYQPSYPSTATMLDAVAPQSPAKTGQQSFQLSMQEHNLPMTASSSSASANATAQSQDSSPSQNPSTADSSAMPAQGEAGPSNYAVGNIAGADGEITLSSSIIDRPSLDDLPPMEVHVHGIPTEGAKSRVETQIKAHVELVRSRKQPSADKTSDDGAAAEEAEEEWKRIGSFSHLKLPPLSATKRKTKKNQQSGEIPKEKTLYLDVAVVTASPPHQRAFACTSCSERERKRAERRKSGRAKTGPIPSEDEMRRLGVDPAAPDAISVAQERLIQEESKRIILFNCGDYVEFKDGHAELPTRITCYCRHHGEKLGFCILFTMRNWKGKTVACGSTPAILITDDHKSSASQEKTRRATAAAAAAVAANGGLPDPMILDSHHNLSQFDSQSSSHRQRATVSAERSRANSTETDAIVNTNGGASRSSKSTVKRSRPKPYDSSRRSTVSSANGVSVAGTGASSPTIASQQQQQGFAQPMDLVQALAAIGNERAVQEARNMMANGNQLPNGNHAGPPATDNFAAMAFQPLSPMAFGQSPLDQQQAFQQQQQQQQQFMRQSFPCQQQLPQQQQQQQQHFMNVLSEGSISPDTMSTNPFSLPQIDFGNNLIAQQMLALLGQQGLLPRGSQPNDKAASSDAPNAPPQQPPPVISKIIPGEGPTTGGIEVTVLGENFVDGLACFFGDLAASSTRVWASNTLICVLPPSPSPGPVAVTVRDPQQAHQPPQGRDRPLQLFTYIDKCDTQLMELALQVVGFQQTRTMQLPREIALRLLATGQGSINSNLAAQQQQQSQQQRPQQASDSDGRSAIEGLFTGSSSSNFQDTIINFLTSMLSVDTGVVPPRLDAIRLSNRNGHTLLHLAVSLGFHRLVTRLLDLGCPLDARDKNGLTALHLAALNGRVTVTKMLLQRGARSGMESFAKLTPADLATGQGHDDVLEVLVSHTTEVFHEQQQQQQLSPRHRLAQLAEEDESSYEEEDEEWDAHLDAEVTADADADNISTEASSFDDENDEGGWTESDLDYDDSSDSSDEDSEDDGAVREDGIEVGAPVAVSSDATPRAELSPQAGTTPRVPSSPFPSSLQSFDEKKVLSEESKEAPPSNAPLASDEKKLLQERDSHTSTESMEKKRASEKDSKSTMLSPRGGLRSLANLVPMTGFGGIMGTGIAMPATAISVFQMTMPNSVIGSDSTGLSGEKASRRNATSDSENDDKTASDTDTESRLMSLFKHIVVDSRLWTSGGKSPRGETSDTESDSHTSPPPAYEAVSGGSETDARGADSKAAATAPWSSAGPREGDEKASDNDADADASEEDVSSPSSMAGPSSHPAPSQTQTQTPPAPAPAPSKRRMGYEDDWMLRWFWLPCLILALLIAAFSTGPLSLTELGAYVPTIRRG